MGPNDSHDQPDTPVEKPVFIDAKRRGFLQGAAVASGLAATGLAEAHAGHGEDVVPQHDHAEGDGYRETDHVRTYYQRARF